MKRTEKETSMPMHFIFCPDGSGRLVAVALCLAGNGLLQKHVSRNTQGSHCSKVCCKSLKQDKWKEMLLFKGHLQFRKSWGGAGEAVRRTTRYFHSYGFLKLKEMSVLFTSIIAPKFKTTGSLAKVYVLILLEE